MWLNAHLELTLSLPESPTLLSLSHFLPLTDYFHPLRPSFKLPGITQVNPKERRFPAETWKYMGSEGKVPFYFFQVS